MNITGLVIADLVGPKTNLLAPGPKMRVKLHLVVPNLVTQVGDQAYGDALAGLHANATVTDPTPPAAMFLGTTATTPTKTGAAAAIIAYITGSNKTFEVTYPQSSLNGTSRRISWQCIWAAGVATNAAIAEVAMATVSTNAAPSAANTVARSVFSPTIDKQAGDTLTVTWHHDLLGS